MSAHRHQCPRCRCTTRCCDDRCDVFYHYDVVLCDVPRLCPKHARAEWHRFCEIVSACVMAACAWDLADACAEIAIDVYGDETTIGRRAAKEAQQRAVNALCGAEMDGGVPGLPRDGLRERLGTAAERRDALCGRARG